MRTLLVLLGTASTLAACSGGSTGAQSVGSIAAPAGTGTPTPTANDIYSQFANPTEAHTYKGLGGSQTFTYTTDSRVVVGQQAQVYAGNATTVRDSGITVTYDPRDAIFTLTVSDPRSGASTNTRFQDPANRVNFGGSNEPQWGTPDLSKLPSGALGNGNIAYLQAGDGNPISPYLYSGSGFINPGSNTTPPDGNPGSSYQGTSFFYEKPGSTTKYVTFAGYVRNSLSFNTVTLAGTGGAAPTTITQDLWTLERGAFAYGAQTANSAVPTSGTGTFNGSVLASMVYNPTLDNTSQLPTYFQWLSGTSALAVDFGAKTVKLKVDGFVYGPQVDRYTAPTLATVLNGASFTGTGAATIDLAGKGGFSGMFSSFAFTNPGSTTALPVTVAGSSIDGAFFGPAAQEVGGGFRVVGATPDQRIDILGTFTGKK